MKTSHDLDFHETSKAHSWSPSDMRRRIALLAFRVAAVSAFIGLVLSLLWLYSHGYPRLVAATTLIGFMLAAASQGGSWLERIALGVSIFFCALGGAVGYHVYIAMFSFLWFESMFNDKGSGLMGLLLFVSGFAVASGLSASWLLDRAFLLRSRSRTSIS